MPERSPLEAVRAQLEKAERALVAERLDLGLGNPVLAYAAHYHRTDRGDPLVFEGRPWLLSLYEMWGKEPPRGTDVAFMKATQVGVSELAVVLSWAWCGELGYRLMYVLPREEDRTAFYAMRIKKPLRHTARYQALTKQTAFDSRSEFLMSIGRGFFRLAASNAPASFVSVPLDAYIIDEVDKCDQTNILLAEDRLSWPESRKVRIRIGNPTVSDFGIHALYLAGSQHRWHVRCLACGIETELDWYRHVVREQPDGTYGLRDQERAREGAVRALCDDCGGELDRSGAGRWIAAHPERPRRSFHISKLIDGRVGLRDLWEEFALSYGDAKRLQVFANGRLGLPYAPRGGKLTRALIRSRRFGYVELSKEAWAPIRTMGIDVGSPHKVVVSDLPDGKQLRQILRALGRIPEDIPAKPGYDPRLDGVKKPPKLARVRRLLGAYEVAGLEGIDALVERYRPRCIVIDSRPEVEAVIAARKRWGRLIGGVARVWRCEFLWDGILDLQMDASQDGLVKVDRTLLLDRHVRDWNEGLRVVPKDVEDLAGGAYVEEMLVPTRVQEETPRGLPVFRWSKGKDHFFLADGYDRLAAELCRFGQVAVGEGELFPGL